MSSMREIESFDLKDENGKPLTWIANRSIEFFVMEKFFCAIMRRVSATEARLAALEGKAGK